MPRIFAAVVAALLILTAAHTTLAQGLVGATVPEDFPMGTKRATDFKGKYTVLYFWDSTKPECVKGLKEVVRLYKAYGKSEKFGTFILYNVDGPQSGAAARQLAKGIPFDQVFEGPEGNLTRQLGIPPAKLPVAYIMSPELQFVWADEFSKLEETLVKLLGVDKAAAPVNPESEDQAVMSMAEALQVVKDRGEFTPVVERLAGITPKMLEDPAVMVAATQVVLLLKLETENRKGIERALEKYPKAKNVVRIVSRKAQNALNAPLPGEEETAAAPGAAPPAANTREALAARKLTAAEELQLEGRDVEAYEQFKDIASRYRGTPAADTAGHHVGDYEADPAFMKKFNAEVGEEKAQAMLRMARSYKQAGRNDLARKAIDEMLASYPESGAAREAKAEGLDKL